MIKVKKIVKPSVLDSGNHYSQIENSRNIIRENLANNVDEKKIFTEKWRKVKSIKEELFISNNGKCAYCETKERHKRTMDVEHFRPKSAVHDIAAHPGYWWLAEETDNYLLSCKICNSDHKGSNFPLIDESNRAYSENDDLSQERPLLINPIEEKPSTFIGYNNMHSPIPLAVAVGIDKDDRGYHTIKKCGLNDDDLCSSRGEHLSSLQLMANTMHVAIFNDNDCLKDKIANTIKQYTRSAKQFAGFRRNFFIGQDLEKFIADD